MSEDSLTQSIKAATKAAMKAKAKDRLTALRLIQAEFKRIEVDERIDVDDARALAVLDKMVKQRRDSAQQFTDADRIDLADKENAEIEVIQEFLPSQLSEKEQEHTRSLELLAQLTRGQRDLGTRTALELQGKYK